MQRKKQVDMAVISGITMPGCQMGVKNTYGPKTFLCPPVPGKTPKRVIPEAGTVGIRQT